MLSNWILVLFVVMLFFRCGFLVLMCWNGCVCVLVSLGWWCSWVWLVVMV